MKKKFFSWLSFVALTMIISSTQTALAQVTIGNDKAPAMGSLLQIKDREPIDPLVNNETVSKGGFLLPRVSLIKLNTLQPFIPDSTAVPDYPRAKLLNVGLVVYNLNNTGNGFNEGIYQWNGHIWKGLSSEVLSTVSIDDCSRINVSGSYFVGSSLNASNYITLPMNVASAGSYSLVARTSNGYYFHADGTFPQSGKYDVRLEGIGVPLATGVDPITIIVNGSTVKTVGCDPSVTVQPSVVSYQMACDNIVQVGTPISAGEALDGSEGVSIPVVVTSPGRVQLSTGTINGIYYAIDQVVDTKTTQLILKANGLPQRAGLYTYDFMTNGAVHTLCNFRIQALNSFGTLSNPAKSCYAIHQLDSSKKDGEYWIRDVYDKPVKTFCDMTNGGYTMVWSYSENTAYNIYGSGNSIAMDGATFRLNVDNPQNVIKSGTETINYNNYRLERTTMQIISEPNSNPSFRVRIANDATDMNDTWGLNNYMIINPDEAEHNPLNETPSVEYWYNTPAHGKLWGYNYYGVGSTRTIADFKVTDGALYLSSYANHFNFGNSPVTNRRTVLAPDGVTQIDLNIINNVFGFFGEIQQNHHFGKCTSNDYSFSVSYCASGNLKPHSFNNGEGRILQWFVK